MIYASHSTIFKGYAVSLGSSIAPEYRYKSGGWSLQRVYGEVNAAAVHGRELKRPIRAR